MGEDVLLERAKAEFKNDLETKVVNYIKLRLNKIEDHKSHIAVYQKSIDELNKEISEVTVGNIMDKRYND